MNSITLKFSKLTTALVGSAYFIALCLGACDKEINNVDASEKSPASGRELHVGFASGSGSPSATYLQSVQDLSQGEISFSGKGYQLKSTRTARFFASDDGSLIYNLDYPIGTIVKLRALGGEKYEEIGAPLDASIPLKAKAVRFTKLDDKEASVHYILSKPRYTDADPTKYERHTMTVSIGLLNLETMSFGTNYKNDIDVVLPGTLGTEGYYISRIDTPVKSNGKLYYGANVNKWNQSSGKGAASDLSLTLVIDYPSLTNPVILLNTVPGVKGSTNGYRTTAQYVNEQGEILQMVSDEASGETSIVKIVNGQYDNSFRYNLSALLGNKKTSSNGWFYVGKGIGYMPYEKLDAPKMNVGVDGSGNATQSAPWGLARIDLNNNSVVDLETPADLWLQQYQDAVVRNGYFFIALSPIGGNGNIYIFDVNSTSPTGAIGAKITSGADQYYIGVY